MTASYLNTHGDAAISGVTQKRHGTNYLPKRTDSDFDEWRQDAAWHAAKYARWDRRAERRI